MSFLCHGVLSQQQKGNSGAGERAQQLRALTAFPEDLDLIPSIYVLAYNHL